MEKKSKEALRRYKKARPSSSDSSSSSDSDSSSSDSYSSSSSKKKSTHRKKKVHAAKRSSSSSDDDKARKREKQHACQKKLEAKRNHLKRKLKEAKAKKRAISPSMRRRSITPPHKTKKLVEFSEKKHHQLSTKERMMREKEREREKLRLRERERERSRSPKSTKIRMQEISNKSPNRHQIPIREKIIIQARRDHNSSDRKRELKVHHDSRERERRRERAEREAARNKEREEALARCQERQRERERVAREKLRREKEKDYERSAVDRLLPRPAEREMAIAVARGYGSRERSLEPDPRAVLHGRSNRVLRDGGYDREREFITGMEMRGEREERDRHGHDRDFVVVRRREVSPSEARYIEKLRERELYPEEERYPPRPYELPEEELRGRERKWEHDIRREHEHGKMYPTERSSTGILPPGRDWKPNGPEEWEHWQEKGWPRGKKLPPTSETEWEAKEKYPQAGGAKWDDTTRKNHEHTRGEGTVMQPAHGPGSRRWPQEWRGSHAPPSESVPHTPVTQRHSTPQQGNFRIGPLTPNQSIEFNPERPTFRHRHPHPMPLLQHGPTGPVNFHPRPLFPSKRQMTYTNPNLIKNKVGIPTPVQSTTSHIPPLLPGLIANPPIKAPSAGAPPTVDKEAVVHISPAIKTHAVVQKEISSPIAKKPDEETSKPVIEDTTENAKIEVQENVSALMAPSTEETEIKTEVDKEEAVPDDLSEISDGDDDILDKVEDKSHSIVTSDPEIKADTILDTEPIIEKTNISPLPIEDNEISKDEDPIVAAIINDDVTKSEINEDDILDFEEISDGELEEEAKTKVVGGDALGVDWESLIADAKIPINSMEPTTAKQKWQPHRIIMEIGISTKMAGEEFARQILQNAKEKLDEEIGKPKIKQEIKDEGEEDDHENDCKNAVQLELLNAIACVQVGQRQDQEDRLNLIFNAYGDNSRALSARQDLRLRRKLCGLPVKEMDYAQPVSDRMKSLAIKMFQKTIET